MSFAVRSSRFPHMCRALLRFPHLSFMPPVPYPPLRGALPMRGRLCIGDSDSLANGALETISHSLSYRHCPIRLTSLVTFPLRGRLYVGDSDALVYGALETIFSFSFIPLPPSNLRPFGAPPSIGRRECPREPLPLEGAAERSEAGLASFWGGARVLVYRLLETISPLFFIPLVPYPPLRGTFPLRGRIYVGDSDARVYDALETIFSLSFIPPVPYLPLRGTFPSRGRLCPSLSVSPHILVFTLTI